MSNGQTDLISKITGKMQWLTERQRVLAQNVAHADTAGYKPKDLAAFDFKSSLQQAMVTPQVTQPNHILVGHRAQAAGVQIINSKVTETSPSGNGVNLESEMMKVSQTGVDYQEMASLLKKWQVMVRTAIGRQ